MGAFCSFLYRAMLWLPSKPPSSPAYQWNSTGPFLGVYPAPASTRKASRMVAVPEPSSSAPGAGSSGKWWLIESWCAPRMVRGWEKLRALGSKRAMMDDCGKG